MFCGFDGHHLDLDDEFAFALCATREEWEKQQEEYREFSAAMEVKRLEREANGNDPLESVWTSSYVDEELVRNAGASSPLSMMALAMRAAELVSDLQDADASRDQIETLNRDFDAYRAADGDLTLSAAAATQLAETLERIASVQPHLTAKAADLQSQLDERRRQQTDFDFPF